MNPCKNDFKQSSGALAFGHDANVIHIRNLVIDHRVIDWVGVVVSKDWLLRKHIELIDRNKDSPADWINDIQVPAVIRSDELLDGTFVIEKVDIQVGRVSGDWRDHQANAS